MAEEQAARQAKAEARAAAAPLQVVQMPVALGLRDKETMVAQPPVRRAVLAAGRAL